MTHLAPEQPIYGLQARGLAGNAGQAGEAAAAVLPSTIEEMAAEYVERLRAERPDGPYRVLGWSFGGLVAHAVATRLQRDGLEVDRLVIVDSYPPDHEIGETEWADHEILAPMLDDGFDYDADELVRDPEAVLQRYARYLRRADHHDHQLAGVGEHGLLATMRVYLNNNRIMGTFQPEVFDGDVLFFSATRDTPGIVWSPEVRERLVPESWRPYVTGEIRDHRIDATHPALLTDPAAIAEIGKALAAGL
jgi:thioesterase domain-containing protein